MPDTRTLITVDEHDLARLTDTVERLEQLVERLIAREVAPSPGLTRAEAAEMLRVSVRSLATMIDRGDIRVVRFGTRIVVPRTEIDRLLGG